MTLERFNIVVEEIARDRYAQFIQSIQTQELALDRSMPPILQSLLSKRRPRSKPPLPTYEQATLRISDGRTVYDTAKPEDTFTTELWWKKPRDPNIKPTREKKYGGEKVLEHEHEILNSEDLAFLDQ